VWHRKRQKWLLSALSEKEMQLRHEKIQTQKAQEGWSIQESEITLGAKVGSGSYGDVFKGKWAPLKDTPVAIKLIPFAPGERAAALDDAEMLLMQRIRHPRLVLFFGSGVLKSRNCSFMVTEFLAGGDLMEFIGTAVTSNDYEGAYPWETRVRSAMDIAEGMEYLHSRDWIHRDLKSANILRDEMGRCKIADFGLSKSFSGRSNSWSGLGTTCPGPAISLSAPQKRSMDTKMEMTAFAGSGPWMAPELITSRMSDVAVGGKEVDVYSFGCVLYELVEGRLPWSDAQCLEDIFGSVEHGGRPNLTLPVPSEFKKSCIHSKVCSLMSDCWQQSASRRPSFSKIAKILRSLYKDQCRKQANMHVDRGATKAKRSKYKASALILSSDSLAGNDRASFQNPILQMVTSERK
jgi:B-Raf proto-oncogene serine/threonine-protein kinase